MLIRNFTSLWIVFREQLRAVRVHSGAKRNLLVKVYFNSFRLSKPFFFLSNYVKLINFFISTECPLGYHSFNCSEICKFPTYGEDCQHVCNCSLELCSHRVGCEISNGMVLYTYIKIYNNNNISIYTKY